MSNFDVVSSPDVRAREAGEPDMTWVLKMFGLHGPAYDDMTDAEKVEKLERQVIDMYDRMGDKQSHIERLTLANEATEEAHQRHTDHILGQLEDLGMGFCEHCGVVFNAELGDTCRCHD